MGLIKTWIFKKWHAYPQKTAWSQTDAAFTKTKFSKYCQFQVIQAPKSTMGHQKSTMGHIRVNVGHLRVTVGHIRVTVGHLRVIGDLRVTIGYLKATIGHLRVTIGHPWLTIGYIGATVGYLRVIGHIRVATFMQIFPKHPFFPFLRCFRWVMAISTRSPFFWDFSFFKQT